MINNAKLGAVVNAGLRLTLPRILFSPQRTRRSRLSYYFFSVPSVFSVVETGCRWRTLANGYNGISNENLVTPGFDGGTVVGARRPRLHAAAASQRAVGDEVSPAASGPAAILRSWPIRDCGSVTVSRGACFCPKCAGQCQPESFRAISSSSAGQLFARSHFRWIG